MKHLRLAIVTVVGAVLMSGCSLSKMVKLAKESELTVTPDPLEVHGGKVPHELSATLPPKILPSGKMYTIYTFYQYGDQKVMVGSESLLAEDYPSSDTEPTDVQKSFSFDYKEGMNPGKLMLYGEAKNTKNDKRKYTDTLEVASGLIITSLHVEPAAYASFADHGYVAREELIPTRVNFYFPQSKSTVNMGLNIEGKSNRDRQRDLSAFIAEKNVTRTVTITGTHSPEGPESLNSRLSEDRAAAIEKIYRREMSKYDYKGMADSIEFIKKPVFQDWTEFKQALAEYDGISEEAKAQMNRIINGTGTFVDKEYQLQEVEGYDKVFRDVYPGLRSAKTEILTVKEKKTPAEISVLAKQIVEGKAEPDTLSVGEMLFAAEQTPSLEEKEAIYMQVTKMGESWVAHNNLGATYLEMAANGDMSKVDEALTQLEIAKNLNSTSAEVAANMGAAYVMQGEYAQAYDVLSNTSGGEADTRANINSMKGAIEIMNGDYDAATASLAAGNDEAKTNVNKGLAYLLAGDNTQATNALIQARDDEEVGAKAYYLSAVTAARMNDGASVESNIRKAVAANPDMKEMALTDLEFRNHKDQVNAAVR
jgi:tetratricopeptide (TPR) repeat protein